MLLQCVSLKLFIMYSSNYCFWQSKLSSNSAKTLNQVNKHFVSSPNFGIGLKDNLSIQVLFGKLCLFLLKVLPFVVLSKTFFLALPNLSSLIKIKKILFSRIFKVKQMFCKNFYQWFPLTYTIKAFSFK